jgi:hypothetical protein
MFRRTDPIFGHVTGNVHNFFLGLTDITAIDLNTVICWQIRDIK